jgi:hypothetical protein
MITDEIIRNDKKIDTTFFDKCSIAYKVENAIKYARPWTTFVCMFPSICFTCENVCHASKFANEINNNRIGFVLAKNDSDNSTKHVIALTVAENGCDTTPLILVSHVVNGNLKAILHVLADFF